MGHVVSSDGVSTDPEKISAVKDWPTPHNKKQLRSFLGFCSYYRKFIKGFSSIARPLHALTGEHCQFLWTDESQETFLRLKQALASPSILSFPKGEREFTLDTDASNISLDAVLSQKQEGKEVVITYFSLSKRVLSKTEKNYCVTRQECGPLWILLGLSDITFRDVSS